MVPNVHPHNNPAQCLPALQVKVVNRELVAVLTQATLTDPEMLQAQPDAAYLLSITEQELPPVAQTEAADAQQAASQGLTAKCVRIGVCAVDVATARILLGQWYALYQEPVDRRGACICCQGSA